MATNPPDLTPVSPEQEPQPSVPPTKRNWVVRLLKTVQRYSAYGIATFAGLHLTATAVLPAFSVSASNSAFMVGRDIYQSTFGEPLLVYGAFGAHLLSGVGLRAHRIYRQYADYGRFNLGKPTWASITGGALTLLVAGHYGAMRWAPVAALGDSSLMSLDFVVYALNSPDSTQVFSILTLMTGLFGVHALLGGAQYLRSIRNLGLFARWALISVLTILVCGSLSKLAKEEPATGWLAQQFDLIHHTFEQKMSS